MGSAERILSTVNELRENFTYLLLVTPEVLDFLQNNPNGESLRQKLGGDIIDKIAQQLELEKLLIHNNFSNTKPSVADDGASLASNSYSLKVDRRTNPVLSSDLEDRWETARTVKKNTLELCRRLRAVPTVVTELQHFIRDSSPQSIQLLHVLAEMQEVVSAQFNLSHTEEVAREQELAMLISKESDELKRHAKLEAELESMRSHNELAAENHRLALKRLSGYLQELKATKESDLNNLIDSHKQTIASYEEEAEQVSASNVAKLSELQPETKQQKENWEQELANINRKSKIASKEVAKWVSEAQEVGKRREIEFVPEAQELDRINMRIAALQDHFQKIDVRAREKPESPTELLRNLVNLYSCKIEKLIQSATIIEKSWRDYVRRREELKEASALSIKKKKKKKKRKKQGLSKKPLSNKTTSKIAKVAPRGKEK